jgi:hypothetical protein
MSWERSERHFIAGREKEHRLLVDSQARPIDRSTVKVKMLGWLEAVA